MCNCKTELEAKMLARAKEVLPESTDHNVEIDGYVFGLTNNNGVVQRQALTVVIKHTCKLKNGSIKQKVEKQKIMATFCMFCGERQVVEG